MLLLDQHAKMLSASHQISVETEKLKGTLNTVSGPFFTCFSTISDQKTYSVLPIYNHEKNCGYLLIPDMVQAGDKGLILTIEQAANVISFELLKENALKQFSRRARNEFFNNFIERTFSSDDEIKNRAKEFKLRWDQNTCASPANSIAMTNQSALQKISSLPTAYSNFLKVNYQPSRFHLTSL